MAHLDEEESFIRVARAIAPLGDRIVVIGGWAHRLHRLVDRAGHVEFEPLRTEDVDLAASVPSSASAYRLDTALEKAGFRAEPIGDETPPATKYVSLESPSFDAQFVAQRPGSGHRRRGGKTSTVVVCGVIAECVRHVDLLCARPWPVDLTASGGFHPSDERLRVYVVNAAAFMAQKLLIARYRAPADRAKDIVYVHDTLAVFAGALGELKRLWNQIAHEMHPATARRVARLAVRLGSGVSDPIRDAARILVAQGRGEMPADTFRATLAQGLERLFGA